MKIRYFILLLPISVLFNFCKPEEVIVDPIAEVVISETVTLVDTQVSFTNLSNEGVNSWDWEFDGGQPSTSKELNPIVTYSQPGVYSVKLTVSNGVSKSTVILDKAITVLNTVNAGLSSLGDSIVYTKSDVSFESLYDEGVTNWYWEFEGGEPATSNENNPTVSFNESGTHNVTLIISNELSADTITLVDYILSLPEDGLVAFYPFNGNAVDSVDNSGIQDGTIYGAQQIADRDGNQNKAYQFDGINDWIKIANSASFEPQNFTISIWVNAANETGSFVSMSTPPSGNNNCGYLFGINTGILRGYNNIGVTNWAKAMTSNSIMLNTWIHTVFSYDGSILSLYVDGQLMKTFSDTNAVRYIEQNNIVLGTYATNAGGNWFTGSLDDFRFYNRALTQQEVTALSLEPAR